MLSFNWMPGFFTINNFRRNRSISQNFHIEIATKKKINRRLIHLVGCGQPRPTITKFHKTSISAVGLSDGWSEMKNSLENGSFLYFIQKNPSFITKALLTNQIAGVFDRQYFRIESIDFFKCYAHSCYSKKGQI